MVVGVGICSRSDRQTLNLLYKSLPVMGQAPHQHTEDSSKMQYADKTSVRCQGLQWIVQLHAPG